MKNKKTPMSKSALLLRDTYDIYAKMLAVENIRVVFDEAISAPAQFDILNRVLYISPVHSSQADLIPGLVIHEVGHALFSTLTDTEAKKLKKITKLLNIIDDGYQERMMCKKYANSKKHLFKVFDHFFLKSDQSVYLQPNKLINIVNILNFNCKGFKHGHYKQYPSYVEAADLKMLQEAELITIDTLIGRNEFAKELAKVLKKYGEMPEDNQDIGERSKGDGEAGDGDESESTEEDDEDGQDGEEGDGDGDDSDEDDEEAEPQKKKKKSSKGSEAEEDDVEKMLSDKEDKLNDHHEKFKHQMNKGKTYELPTGRELLEIAEIVDLYEKDGDLDKALLDTKNLTLMEKYKACLKESKKIASRIFTKFNMRVQAQNYANTQYKKSGSLDPERAALYQVYDDVFMKNAIDPNQPNHAYTIMLDWSGSMDYSLYALTLRIMELTYFAKSAGIEIEVWLYTTGYKVPKSSSPKNIAMMQSKFIKILNTKKNNPTELDQRVKHLWMLAHEIGSSTSPKIVGTGADGLRKHGTMGTNILEGLILGHHQLSLMEADVKTCFILSDGGDTSSFDILRDAYTGKINRSGGHIKIYVGGIDVDFLYKGHCTRANATAALADQYLQHGQRTTGVAWNTSPSVMENYCQSIVVASAKTTKEAYIHADNLFIDEIVKNLL